MSAAEILEELPRLSPEEIAAIYQRADALLHGGPSSPELLAAVDEADQSPRSEDLPGEQVQTLITQWAHTE